MILAIYDVSGIQEYIFASSRMRENIGASKIVGEVLKEHLPQIMEQKWPNKAEVLTAWDDPDNNYNFHIDRNEHVKAEVIYIGGGNAIVAFQDADDYHAVNQSLAKRLIEVSYTLSLAVASIETDFSDFVADKKWLDQQLECVKARMQRQRPPGAFPISEQEGMTGLPVTNVVEEGKELRPMSTVQRLKSEASEHHRREVIPFPEGVKRPGRWAFEMEELIQGKDEDSYVAVVHIDGNGMGKQLREKLQETAGSSYAEAVMTMRKMSKKISGEYREIFDKVIHEMLAVEGVAAKEYLQIRPLIMDGDDLTFVCKASWGVPLAALLLREMEKKSHSGEPGQLSLSACAGVALVHSHFPFNIAYEVAEECCRKAKAKRVAEGDMGGFIDFKLVRGSNPQEDYDTRVCNRPYRIGSNQDFLHWTKPDDFGFLAGCMRQLASGKWPRSRMEKLYAAYLGQPEQLQLYLEECKTRKYRLDDLYEKGASIGEASPSIFDGLELLDAFELQLLDNVCSESDKEGAE